MQNLPKPPRTIESEKLRLCFESIRPGDKNRGFVPFYHFQIHNLAGEKVGHINFRVGDTEHVRNCAGHISYVVLEQFRGQRFAYYACRALSEFISSIYDSVIITTDPDNHASIKTIERLRCQFMDELPVSPHEPQYARGSRVKRRYLWHLKEPRNAAEKQPDWAS